MQTFPLIFPENVPGIYALVHTKTGKLYVGRTRALERRYREWRALARGDTGQAPRGVRTVMDGTDPSEWEFAVILSCLQDEDPTPEIFKELEQRLVADLKAQLGDDMVEGVQLPPAPPYRRNQWGLKDVCRTELTYEGNPISYADAREILGIPARSLYKRLYAYRLQGMVKVSVEQMIARGVGSPTRKKNKPTTTTTVQEPA